MFYNKNQKDQNTLNSELLNSLMKTRDIRRKVLFFDDSFSFTRFVKPKSQYSKVFRLIVDKEISLSDFRNVNSIDFETKSHKIILYNNIVTFQNKKKDNYDVDFGTAEKAARWWKDNIGTTIYKKP